MTPPDPKHAPIVYKKKDLMVNQVFSCILWRVYGAILS